MGSKIFIAKDMYVLIYSAVLYENSKDLVLLGV
jgi:hypothetical protein